MKDVSLPRLLLKAAILFAAANLLFAWMQPLPALGRLSVYNGVVPGRERLPFGENPEAYNLSLYQLEAMVASHEVQRAKAAEEYRVLILGDSSVWGILLEPGDTLAGRVNAGGYTLPDGRRVTAYNLGYPTISVTKDLLLLSHAVEHDPDLIIWMTTLEALPHTRQTDSPLVANNAASINALRAAYGLDLPPLDEPSFGERTLIGQRRALADVLRLNAFGVMWAATGVDQFYPETYTPRAEDLDAERAYYDLPEPLTPDALALEVIAAGHALAGDVPLVLVNEPMFVSEGANSDIRYNFYYPRWAYDDYRRLLETEAAARGWAYLDLWQAVDNDQFTNSAIHYSAAGAEQLARRLGEALGWAD